MSSFHLHYSVYVEKNRLSHSAPQHIAYIISRAQITLSQLFPVYDLKCVLDWGSGVNRGSAVSEHRDLKSVWDLSHWK